MQHLFGWLFIATFIVTIVGLIKPSALCIKRLATRLRVFWTGTTALFVFFVLFSAVSPETEDAKQRRLAEETEAKDQERVTALHEAEQARADAETQAKIEAELAAAEKAKERARKDKETREALERKANLEREAKEKAESTPHFSFTVDQFMNRYTKTRKVIGIRPYFLRETKKTDYDEFQVLILQPNEDSQWYFSVKVSKIINTVVAFEYVRFIVKGDDPGELTKQFLTETVAFIVGIEDFDLPDDRLGKRLDDLDFNSVMTEGQETKAYGENVVYKAVFVKAVSMLSLSATPR